MTWQWYTNQGFAFIALILTIISFQQQSARNLLIYRNLTNISIFVGLCFILKVPAMLSCGAAVLRNACALFFNYFPNLKHEQIYKYLSGSIIVIILVVLNILFWNGFLSVLSILVGLINILAYFQTTASKIRIISLIGSILLVIEYALILSPTNVIVNLVGVISTIVGIIRLDIHKENKAEKI